MPRPARSELRLLGPAVLLVDGAEVAGLAEKGLALLAYLALRGRPVPRAEATELLWAAGRAGNLRQLLHKLRRLPAAADWLGDGDELELRLPCDARAFLEAVEDERWEAALALWRGPLLAGVAPDGAPAWTEWLEHERRRLAEARRRALLGRAAELEALGAPAEALALLRSALADDLLDEPLHRAAMRLHAVWDGRDAAVAQFERLRVALRDELDVEPLRETLELLADIEGGVLVRSVRALLATRPDEVPHRAATLEGRAAAARELDERLVPGARLLLQGLGGVGKTALAAEIAAGRAAGAPVLWLEVGRSGPEALLGALAHRFEALRGLPGLPRSERAARLAAFLTQTGVGLVVLDDVWNAYALASLLDLLPAGLPLLATSRQRYGQLERVPLGRLERAAARALLARHAGRAPDDADADDALCAALGDHPFAVRLAGLLLAREGLEPAELLARVRRAPHDLRLPDEPAGERSGSVAALLEESLAPLPDPAYEAFLAFGALAAGGATAELLAPLLRRDPDAVEEDLFELARRGLAERDATPGSDLVAYRLHDLTHAFAHARRYHRPASVARAALGFARAHRDDPAALAVEVDNLLGAARDAPAEELVALGRLLALDSGLYRGHGHSERSVAVLRRAADAARRTGDLATAHDLLGKIGDALLDHLGEPGRALDAYREALALAERRGDAGRAAVFESVLGVVLARRGDPDADRRLEAALARARAADDPLALATVLEQRGFVEGSRGRPAAAEAHLREALGALARHARRDRRSDPEELLRRRFFALSNLAQTQHDQGRHDEALATRAEARALADAAGHELWRALCRWGDGETLLALGRRAEAGAALREARGLYERRGVRDALARLTAYMAAEGVELEPPESRPEGR